ncbi:MAG TPA: pantoate--beta-alanine ligase, partial [Cytophagaceae bacterium]|jgi:pantoate--beta-alanine ligase|nr:pantoate--beta-alanine ligase [Cytophagaceae bacterium]
MKLLKTVVEAREYCLSNQKEGLAIGLVPTMGALHEGHISLVEASRKDNSITIASIFVNPIQFNNPSDLEKYPRTLEKDLEMLKEAGCNAVFAPSEQEIYASRPIVKMNFGNLENVMEGAFRPGHFSGVGIVVSKLFNIINPNHAYFGQKDLQQFLVIQQMVADLSFPITLHACPIKRESDGLAMSSRNKRLSKENRPVAAKIYQSLLMAEAMLPKEGLAKTKQAVTSFLAQYKELQPEYFEIADGVSLQPIQDLAAHKKIALCSAIFLDGVRLIDNLIIES